MKKLLPAACLLLVLTGCTAGQPAAPAETSPETAGVTVTVTLDLAAYTDTADDDLIATQPLFYLDENQGQIASSSQGSYAGSQAAYEVTVPAGTTDLYMRSPMLALTREVGEQSVAAQGNSDTGDFRIESVEIGEDQGKPAVVVTIDPASAAFPDDLTLHIGEMIRTGGASRRWEWTEESPAQVREWQTTFPLYGSEDEADLEEATLHWSRLCQYTLPTDLPCTADGVTVHTLAFD